MNDLIKQQAWQEKLSHQFEHSEALLNYLKQTLESFSHRYLTSAPINLNGKIIRIESSEKNMGQALKTSVPEIKEGVKWLAKTFTKEDAPALVSSLQLNLLDFSANRGKVEVTSEVNWDYPHYSSHSEKKRIIKQTYIWDDLMKFRKEFPKILEEACDLFL